MAAHYRFLLVGGLIILFLGLLAFLAVPPALALPPANIESAVTVYVTTTEDVVGVDGECSLREALGGMNECGSADTIVLQPLTYVLTDTSSAYKGALLIPASTNVTLMVEGNGRATIQGEPGWSYGILSINSTSSVVAISDVTMQYGKTTGGGGISNAGTLSLTNCQILSNTAAAVGGGILNAGSLIMANTLVMSNTVTDRYSQGGGIYNNKQLTISNSGIVSNTAQGRGGGVYVEIGSLLTILSNVTLSGNSAVEGEGGGLYSSSNFGLSYVTVYSNTATSGGGIAVAGGTAVLTSTILYGNAPAGSNCSGNITSNGYNLIPSSCAITTTGDVTDRDPLLGTLQDNGGTTLTHALGLNSPALDQIANGVKGCGTTISTDQRGYRRPEGIACDIGAYESPVLLDERAYLPLVRR